MVCYQAALIVYPKNYMAANDLGVLLARCGDFNSSPVMLEHSLSLSQQPETWSNLAVVYQQLGQTTLAARAGRESAALQQAEACKAQEQVAHVVRRHRELGRSLHICQNFGKHADFLRRYSYPTGAHGRASGRTGPCVPGGHSHRY